MPDPTAAPDPAAPAATPTPIHLARWTVTSGSNARSRGAVIVDAADHHWRASAEGNGAIDALYRAVDKALSEILDGHPRLLAYDIHAIGEGTDTVGVVTVRIAPPLAAGERGQGEYQGEARGPNIIAASIEAYLLALNAMLVGGTLDRRAGGGRRDRHDPGAEAGAGGGRCRPRAPGRARRGRGRDRHGRLVQPVSPAVERGCVARAPTRPGGERASRPRPVAAETSPGHA